MKLTILLLVATIILPYTLLSQNEIPQDEFMNCVHLDEKDSRSGTRFGEIEFSVRPIRIFEMPFITPEPQYVSIELKHGSNIDSIKFEARDLPSLDYKEHLMLDDGLNGDVQANDNIYTTIIPIQLSNSQGPSSGSLFGVSNPRVRYKFYMQDGSTEGYSSRFRIYYFSEDGFNQFQDYVENNSVTQLNDSVAYSSNIIHIVSSNRTYSERAIDYVTSDFNDLDQIIGENYDEAEMMIFYSYNDIDRESGGNSASYATYSNTIRTKYLSYGLLKHEILHEWVHNGLDYGLSANNGHWGFIERPSCAFGLGCYSGAFQDLSTDPDNGGVNGSNPNYNTDFSNLELFLMQRLPIDSVAFPLYVASGDNLSCSSNNIENAILDSLNKEEFLARYEAEQQFVPLSDFGDTIRIKTVLLYDQRLSDEEVLLYNFEIKHFENYFAEVTRKHCFVNTNIFRDLDADGYAADVDCDDENADINPDQSEEPYNGLDDDCDEMTLDDDLDQDGFLLVDDCDDENADINPDQAEEPYNDLDDDCDEMTLDDDLDQDGFLLVDDCDDENADINPDQSEEPYNGLDDDCDEMTLDDDLDQDGFLLVDDCDDENADINPNAEEIANNGIDEDCDGMDLVTSVYELANSEIKIYPNPAIDVIYIEVSGQLRFTASLFDLNGKVILASNNNQSISVNSIPHGMYFLEIRDQNSGQKVVEKILVGVDH